MRLKQEIYIKQKGWIQVNADGNFSDSKCQLVLAFCSKSNIQKKERIQLLEQKYPMAQIVSCSTAGEISDINVMDDSIVATAIEF